MHETHQPQKSWWAPVYRGLVVNSEGKHIRTLGRAFPLLIYLIIHADRKTGNLWRKHATIAREMGISAGTIRRWLARLRSHDYITLKRTGHAQLIHIQRWKVKK